MIPVSSLKKSWIKWGSNAKKINVETTPRTIETRVLFIYHFLSPFLSSYGAENIFNTFRQKSFYCIYISVKSLNRKDKS
jgi:hypothetical protein